MKTKWTRGALVGVVVAIVAISLWLTLGTGDGPAVPQTGAATQVSTAIPATLDGSALSDADIARLEAALASDDPAVAADALVPELRESRAQNSARLLTADAIGRVDGSTMAVLGDSAATVEIEVTGGSEPGRWLLLLQQVEGRWLIFGTERV